MNKGQNFRQPKVFGRHRKPDIHIFRPLTFSLPHYVFKLQRAPVLCNSWVRAVRPGIYITKQVVIVLLLWRHETILLRLNVVHFQNCHNVSCAWVTVCSDSDVGAAKYTNDVEFVRLVWGNWEGQTLYMLQHRSHKWYDYFSHRCLWMSFKVK